MGGMGGCLCIGCLEKRLGRRLRKRDFDRKHPFNQMPGTPRLRNRREGLGKHGFVLEYDPDSFEAFGADDQSRGVFGTVEEACSAVAASNGGRLVGR
jgi:hypothetical protein